MGLNTQLPDPGETHDAPSVRQMAAGGILLAAVLLFAWWMRR